MDYAIVLGLIVAINGPNIWYLRAIREDLRAIFEDVHDIDKRVTAGEARAKIHHPN